MTQTSGSSVLITGTSSGIGLSTALAFAKAGFRVIATMRDLGKAQTLRERAQQEGVTLDIRALDVQDQVSITAVVDAIIQQYGHLDVLVNNAGTGYLGTTEQTPLAEAQRIFDVNFFGAWRVTETVLPYMREARSGRILSVSSISGVLGQPFQEAYSATKFALEGMMESLAPVARQFGITVSLIEPGPVNTEFVTNIGGILKQSREESEKDPYFAPARRYLASIQSSFTAMGQTSEEIAQVIVEAAQAERPHFRYQTSAFSRTHAARKLVDPTGDAQIEAMARMLGAE